MVHFLEPMDTNQAHIAPPNIYIYIYIYIFGTNIFYLSSFLYDENEKLVDDNKMLPF